jgi:hypothetical protein
VNATAASKRADLAERRARLHEMAQILGLTDQSTPSTDLPPVAGTSPPRRRPPGGTNTSTPLEAAPPPGRPASDTGAVRALAPGAPTT